MGLRNKLIIAVLTFGFLLIPLYSYLTLQKAEYEHLITAGILPSETSKPEVTIPVTPSVEKIHSTISSIPSPTPGFIMPGEPAVLAEATSSPTLKMQVKISDRTNNNLASKVFVGIAEGEVQSNPKFMLSLLAQVDQNGSYSGFSLTGLNENSIYTAYIKGVDQLSTVKQFTMASGINDLGDVPLIDGDVNNDNVIDQKDIQVVKQNLGKTSAMANFDPNSDVNNDGMVNGLDLAIVNQNLGKSGTSSFVIPDQTTIATPSASLQTPIDIGGPEPSPSANGGYWLWIPKVD